MTTAITSNNAEILADLRGPDLSRIASLVPARIVRLAIGLGVSTVDEANTLRDLEGHDEWFRDLRERLDADRHLPHTPRERTRRVELGNCLNLYFAARRDGLRCGL